MLLLQQRPCCRSHRCYDPCKAGNNLVLPTAFPRSSLWSSRACSQASEWSSLWLHTQPVAPHGLSTSWGRSVGRTPLERTSAWMPRSTPLQYQAITTVMESSYDHGMWDSEGSFCSRKWPARGPRWTRLPMICSSSRGMTVKLVTLTAILFFSNLHSPCLPV